MAAIRIEVDDIKKNHNRLTVEFNGIEVDVDRHEKHNQIIYDQNVKLTNELDDLEKVDVHVIKQLEARPNHYHSYYRTGGKGFYSHIRENIGRSEHRELNLHDLAYKR